MEEIIKTEKIENLIIEIRGIKAIVDSDVASLYGVETKRINEAVKNNPDKFPENYIIELTKEEWDKMKSKFSTSTKGGKIKPPKLFTEKGLYMLATILKSKIATKTTISIIETFSKIRELSSNMKRLQQVQNDTEKNKLLKKSGEIISDILEDNMKISDTETSIELNFAVLKFKHTIKRKKTNN